MKTEHIESTKQKQKSIESQAGILQYEMHHMLQYTAPSLIIHN